MPNKLIIFIVLIAIQSYLISQNSIISIGAKEIFDKCNYNITNIENIVILLTRCVSLDNIITASSIVSSIINKY